MDRQHQEEIARFCQRLYRMGYAPAHSGNVSVRPNPGDGGSHAAGEGEDCLYITPSGWCLGDVTPESVVTVTPDGTFSAELAAVKPSSERLIHQAAYDARKSIGAVVHAHPPKATALCVAGISLEQHLLAEVILTLGKVPLIPYILPGSGKLAEAVGSALKDHHAVLLANHGVITTGPTLEDAYFRMELVESLAEIVILARQLGTVNELSPAQVQEIYEKHSAMLAGL